MLCNSTKHPIHHCLETRKLRDKKSYAPTGNDSTRIEQVIHQDLTDIDEGTLSIINTIQTNDKKVHAGQDEDTITLVAKLENESKVEQRNHEKEKHKNSRKNWLKQKPIFLS